METDDWDYFEEKIATCVLIQDFSFPDAIGDLCRKNPMRDANALLLAAISFVTHLDQDSTLVENEAHEICIDWYRLIAVLAADMALMPFGTRTCGDLQMFWMRTNSEAFR